MQQVREYQFERPMLAYSEMYQGVSLAHRTLAPRSWGLFVTLVFCFLAVTALAFGLKSAENTLTQRAWAGQQEQAAMQQPADIRDRLNWGTLARAVFGIETAQAATVSYSTTITRQSDTSVVARPGQELSVTIRFKNTGSKTWVRDGDGYVSLYTYDPKYHKSVLAADDWIDATHAVRIQEKSVAPGEFATVVLPLQAPSKVGKYKETWQLAAENKAWIAGGRVQLIVDVQTPKAVSVTAPAPAPTPVTPIEQYSAVRLIQSHRSVSAVGGEEILFRVGFKNTGKTPWVVREIRSKDLGIADMSGSISRFADSSWITGTQVVKLAENTVAPGALDMYEFTFRAPNATGTYTASFQLYVNDTPVDGGLVDIPVTVTSDAPQLPETAPVFQGDSSSFQGQEQLPAEPRIRVGVYKVKEPMQVRSPFAYHVASCTDTDSTSTLLGELPANTIATLFYSSKEQRYSIEAPGVSFIQPACVRLEPEQPDSYFEVVNLDDRPSWNKNLNYDTFRDTLEIRYAEKNDTTWFINELPIEQYVAGVAEASDYSPTEYHKALMTAVRTYAYMSLSGSKHDDRHFDVDATYDQVYKGYAREQYFKNVTQAVKDTRGELVTYDGQVVITPFFSQSDGRTRAWTEVWGGSAKPWLVSVKTDYDKAAHLKLWGHGVGMSAQDAADRAKNEHLDYKALLAYYYRGTSVEKRYQ